MDDDPEHPERKFKKEKPINSRKILELQPGQHQPLISLETWKSATLHRKMKSSAPVTSTTHKRIYPLTGISRCWECFEHNGSIVTLRGTTLKKDKRTYRCATLQDRATKRAAASLQTSLPAGVSARSNSINQEQLDRHQISYLPGDMLEAQVNALMEQLQIPAAWNDLLAAYFLSDEGLSVFERENFNLRQARARFKQLYLQGDISQAEYEEQRAFINRRLNELKPSMQPQVEELMGFLQDFSSRWREMTTGEQRLILQTIFQGLYFDSQGKLRKALAHPPFDELLGLKSDLSAI